MQIELPWFERILNPNVIAHWSEKAKAKKAAREVACLLALPFKHEFEFNTNRSKPTKYELQIVFHPPRSNFDIDNALAALKSAIDGICYDALAINDADIIKVVLIKGKSAVKVNAKGAVETRPARILLSINQLPTGYFASLDVPDLPSASPSPAAPSHRDSRGPDSAPV